MVLVEIRLHARAYHLKPDSLVQQARSEARTTCPFSAYTCRSATEYALQAETGLLSFRPGRNMAVKDVALLCKVDGEKASVSASRQDPVASRMHSLTPRVCVSA